MSSEPVQIEATFTQNPSTLYNDWLASDIHSKFTGGTADIKPEVGSNFTAWDGYISGSILELEAGKRILHKWRTTEFPQKAEDSILEVVFEANESGGTILTIIHRNLPTGDEDKYEVGWQEHYLAPMKDYYSN